MLTIEKMILIVTWFEISVVSLLEPNQVVAHAITLVETRRTKRTGETKEGQQPETDELCDYEYEAINDHNPHILSVPMNIQNTDRFLFYQVVYVAMPSE
jgi:hypothetical protein